MFLCTVQQHNIISRRLVIVSFNKAILLLYEGRDPFHYKQYVANCRFLPVYNNETTHQDAKRFRENFLKLNLAVFTGSEADGIIEPWQSALFGFWNVNSPNPYAQMVPMHQQDVYTQDAFGLQSMDKAGKLHLFNVPGCYHTDWMYKQALYEKIVAPYLD